MVPRDSMYAIYAYIDPQNHPNGSAYMGVPGKSCLHVVCSSKHTRTHARTSWHGFGRRSGRRPEGSPSATDGLLAAPALERATSTY